MLCQERNIGRNKNIYPMIKYRCTRNPPIGNKGIVIKARKNQPYDFLAA